MPFLFIHSDIFQGIKKMNNLAFISIALLLVSSVFAETNGIKGWSIYITVLLIKKNITT